MEESLIAFRKLLIPDEKLSKTVEPGVCSLDHPTAILRWTPSPALLSHDPRRVTTDDDLLASWLPVIPLIRIQEPRSLGKGNDDGVEHCGELADIMTIGPGDDQRQRDATAVHQDVALASFFSPGLSDSDQLFPAPGVL